MAKAIENGGPAFPLQFEDISGHPQWVQSTGMSLRDYFAAKAMPELMRDVGYRSPFCEVAREAYEMADAMIAASRATA